MIIQRKLSVMHMFKSPIVRRWIDMVFLTFCAVILLLVLERPILRVLSWSVPAAKYFPSFLVFFVIVFIAALAFTVLIRLGGVQRSLHLRIVLFNYPPIWLIGLIGLIVFCSCVVSFGVNTDLWLDLPVMNISQVIGAVLLGVVLGYSYDALNSYQWQCNRQTSAGIINQVDSLACVIENHEKLRKWMLNENPIKLPKEDLFGHKRHSQRIASLLLQTIHANIGVLGPYGSGKSSVINLVEYYLKNVEELPAHYRNIGFSGEVITCRVAGWGQVGDTVAQQVLSLSVEEVKKHVDCMALVSLPENYRQAIGKTNSSLGPIIAAILDSPKDPILQLVKLDSVLAAANIRLVIFLEDLDRNVDDKIIRDEIPSLLDRLRVLKQVSFILAIGTDRQFSDILIRICDIQEAVA